MNVHNKSLQVLHNTATAASADLEQLQGASKESRCEMLAQVSGCPEWLHCACDQLTHTCTGALPVAVLATVLAALVLSLDSVLWLLQLLAHAVLGLPHTAIDAAHCSLPSSGVAARPWLRLPPPSCTCTSS